MIVHVCGNSRGGSAGEFGRTGLNALLALGAESRFVCFCPEASMHHRRLSRNIHLQAVHSRSLRGRKCNSASDLSGLCSPARMLLPLIPAHFACSQIRSFHFGYVKRRHQMLITVLNRVSLGAAVNPPDGFRHISLWTIHRALCSSCRVGFEIMFRGTAGHKAGPEPSDPLYLSL